MKKSTRVAVSMRVSQSVSRFFSRSGCYAWYTQIWTWQRCHFLRLCYVSRPTHWQAKIENCFPSQLTKESVQNSLVISVAYPMPDLSCLSSEWHQQALSIYFKRISLVAKTHDRILIKQCASEHNGWKSKLKRRTVWPSHSPETPRSSQGRKKVLPVNKNWPIRYFRTSS